LGFILLHNNYKTATCCVKGLRFSFLSVGCQQTRTTKICGLHCWHP